MANMDQLKIWLAQIDYAMKEQPETSWTVARMQLAYPSPKANQNLVQIDVLAAAGACNAHAVANYINEDISRIQVEARFNQFELKGRSHILGPFRILLQDGAEAKGTFRQRYADSLFPLQGEWLVPMVIETSLGRLIPRPTEAPVLLRSAEPGEFEIPPIGTWFEKWDPISLVREDDPDGPTIAVVEHAMHIMLNKGKGPAVPPFFE